MTLKRIRRTITRWFAKPTKRFSYSLPDAKLFSKWYNSDTLFESVDWANWNSAIDGFKKRYDGWYFSKMTGGHSSYLDICSLCALVEVFCHYSLDADWHEQKQYKEFLRRLDPAFRKDLASPITVSRLRGGKWETGTLDDFADVFYSGVRCSLHHHGDLAPYAGMSGTGQLIKEIPNAVKSICGTVTVPLVIFDPGKLRKALEKWLEKYCRELKKSAASNAAKNFKRKFLTDFGITIP